MADKLPYFAAESGTYSTTGPSITLSGTALTLGTYPTQTFAAAAADSTLDFDSSNTCAVTVWVDATHWARYTRVGYTAGVLSLATATLQGSAGTISDGATVSVAAGLVDIGAWLTAMLSAGIAPYLTGYTQGGSSSVLSVSGTTLTVPWGGVYSCALGTGGGALTIQMSGEPTTPLTAASQLIISQPASGTAWTLSATPSGWVWVSSTRPAFSTAFSAKYILDIQKYPDGNIVASSAWAGAAA